MAGDVCTAVLSSLQCSLAGYKIIGSHDLELSVSVHIDADQSPSFIDYVEQGVIQFKNIAVGDGETDVSSGCQKCGENVISKERKLEILFGVAEAKCDKCTNNESTPPPSKKRSRKLKRKPEKCLDSVSLGSPVVVLQRIDDQDMKSLQLEASSVPPGGEVRTPPKVSPDDSSTPLTQTPTHPTGSVQESGSIRRSSRTTKSRFRRNTSGEVEKQDDSDPFVYSDLKIKSSKSDKKKIEKSVDVTEKTNKSTKSPQKQSKSKDSVKSKKVKAVDDDAPVYLSESHDEELYFDDEDADPDFVADDDVDEDVAEDEVVDDSAEDAVADTSRFDIKMEIQESTEITALKDVEEVYQNIKKENNVISHRIEIFKVSVPQIHQEEYACTVCHKSYILRRYLVRHQNKAGTVAVLCDVCGAKFHNEEQVEQHKLAHSGINQYMCEVCHKSFPNTSQANKHVKSHLPPHERPFICLTCGKGFTEAHSLQEHELIHAEVKPYQCEKCDAKFAARYLLHAHLKYHSNKTYRCYTCNRVYKVFASLKEHLLVYKDHYTNDEPEPITKLPSLRKKKERKTKRKSLLEQRAEALNKVKALQEKTKNVNNDAGTEGPDELDSDQNIDKALLSVSFHKDTLNLVGHHEEELPLSENEESDVDEEEDEDEVKHEPINKNRSKSKVFPCKICFRKYLTKDTLSKHYSKFGRVTFRCTRCKATFHSKADRTQHNYLHTGQHPYQCKVCFRSFTCLSKCKLHAASHLPTNRRPFVCDICGTGFPFQYLLERHKWVHSKINTFECPVCSQVFRTKHTYELHMDVHRGLVYRCSTCKKEYKYPSSLKDHLKKYKHTSDDKRIRGSYFKPVVIKDKKIKKPESLMCDICGKHFSSMTALGSHQKCHKKKDEPLLNADPEVIKSFALQKHLERIEAQKLRVKSNPGRSGHFRCEKCGREFRLRTSLRRHDVLKHGQCKHQCNVCQKKFFTPLEYERHMLVHNGERSFQCTHCPRAFYHEYALKRHLKIHIAKEKLAHGCNVCGKKFIEACYLREHMRRHTGERPYKCEVCGKACISKSLLKQHKVSHGPKIHVCQLCDKRFSHLSNLTCHMRIHEGVKFNYLCDDCGKSFHSKSGLNRHKIKHLGIKNFVCDYPGCSKSFFFKQELKNHDKSHQNIRPYQCDACGKAFKYQASFSNHLRTHKDMPPLCCEICGKEYFVQSRLNRHMEHHLGQRSLECEQCDKKFITESDLRYHRKQHEATFKCKECSKVFRLETRLKSHKKVHEGSEKVQCPRCNVFYKDLLHLQTVHLKSCQTKKPCPYCGRSCGSIRRLQSHIGVHTGKRPHECQECGSAFVSVDLLQKHLDRHKNKRFPCEQCDKRFNRFSDLQKHNTFHKKQEMEAKKVEQYKIKQMLEQGDPVYLLQEGNQDLLAQAAANIIQESSLQLDPGTVVQYVQSNGDVDHGYSQVLQLDSASIPASSEQVILTTIDTSQIIGNDGNEVLMVAMIPEQQ